MSLVGIRTEPGAPAALPWLPPPDRPDHDALAPLCAALSARLTAATGRHVAVAPAAGPGDPALAVLADLLLARALGGDDATITGHDTGRSAARYRAAAVALIDEVVATAWPMRQGRTPADLEVTIAARSGAVRCRLVLTPPAGALDPVPRDVPLALRVQLAGRDMPASALLPLQPGLVIDLTPEAEMPLVLGDRVVGRAAVTPLPGGGQQATITALVGRDTP